MGLLWCRQCRSGNATAVDAGWSFAIGALAIAYAAFGEGSPLQRGIAAGVAVLWSGRLTWHLVRDRILAGKVEDGRYAALRRHFGRNANAHFAWLYLLQAGLAVGFSVPFLLLSDHASHQLSALQVVGLLLFASGIAVETLADRQLAQHRADPAQRGRTCRRGLWRYSRHPNYFGEWLLWCGIAMIAWPAPAGGYALLVPAVLLLLARFVSGVPFAEQQALRTRGDDYRRYQQETNAFFPWFFRPHPSGDRR